MLRAVALVTVLSACGGDEAASLRSLPGSTDQGGVVLLGIDARNYPVISKSGDPALEWTGSEWRESEWLGGAACRFRDSYREGNVGLDEEGYLWRWDRDGGYYTPAPGPASPEGCDTVSAIAETGEVIRLAPDATGERSEVFRGSSRAGPWVPFLGIDGNPVDLGPPESAHADGEGRVWLLGRYGIAQVHSDGTAGNTLELETIVAPPPDPVPGAGMFDGVVDYSRDFVFTATVQGMTWIQLASAGITLRSQARTCMPSRAVAPDRVAWAVWADGDCGPGASFALYKRAIEDADITLSDWEQVIDLDQYAGDSNDGWVVEVSRRGTVYLVQQGAGGAGVFILEGGR